MNPKFVVEFPEFTEMMKLARENPMQYRLEQLGIKVRQINPIAEVTVFDLVEQLKDQQQEVCPYNTRHGDGKTCDCKYAPTFFMGGFALMGEETGCCELRAAIKILLALQDKESRQESPRE